MMPTVADQEIPISVAQQIPFAFTNGNLGWAIPLPQRGGFATHKRGDSNSGKEYPIKMKMEREGCEQRHRKDSVSFKDVISFWETFQCLGGADGVQNEKGVGPLSQAATFEQILANWEFRGRAGTNTTLEDVVNYAAQRWQKQYSRRRKKSHKKARR